MSQKSKCKELYKQIRDNVHNKSTMVKLGRESLDVDAIDTRMFMEIAKFSGIESTNSERYLREFKAKDKWLKETTGQYS